jgi:hypothetical protein
VLFAREGANVVGCDLKAEEERETVAVVEREGGSVMLDLGAAGLGRRGGVAPGALSLASDQSCWVTGTGSVVDGGYTAR